MRRLLTLVLLPSLLAFGIVLMPTSAGATVRHAPMVARHVSASVSSSKILSLPNGAQYIAASWRGNPNARVTLAFSDDGTSFGLPIDAARDDLGLQRRNGRTYGAIHKADGAVAVRVVTDRPLTAVTILGMTDGALTSSGAGAAQAAQAATTEPTVVPRSVWGATPGPLYRTWAPEFSPTKKIIVHHTADAVDYVDKAGAQSLIQAIYRYHAEPVADGGQDWGDIGYNFIIDKFGNIYEGRYSRDYQGANPTGDDASGNGVTAGHTLGWNSGTVGIALLGTFTTQDVTPAARQALESMLAWEASRHGINPQATSAFVNPTSLATITTANIAGHRDYVATYDECPGSAFYATLPAIRAAVAARITPPSPSGPSGAIFSPMDFTGDARSDVMRVTTTGDLYLYRGNGVGGFAGSGVKIGAGWGVFAKVLSPGDFTGDGRSDLVAVRTNGDLYLYRGNGVGGFAGSGIRIGTGWGIFATVLSPRDFTGDRRSDILARKANGDLFLYRGNGVGRFAGSGVRIGTGWGIFSTLFSPGDFTRDAKADVLGVTGSGLMYLYRGNGVGSFAGSGTKIGSGWK